MKWERCRVPLAHPTWYHKEDRPDLAEVILNEYGSSDVSLKSVAEWRQDGRHYITWHFKPNYKGIVNESFHGLVRKSKIRWAKRE